MSSETVYRFQEGSLLPRLSPGYWGGEKLATVVESGFAMKDVSLRSITFNKLMNPLWVARAIQSRYKHVRRITGLWGVVISCTWTLFQVADWIIERWGSVGFKAVWEVHTTHLPFGWKDWIIGFLSISVLVLWEGSYRNTCKLTDDHERERSALIDLHRKEFEKLISATCPQLVFQKWDQIPQGHPTTVGSGFYLANDGGAAHEIKVETSEIDDQLWVSSSLVSRIEKGGQGFALAWLENKKGIGSSLPGAEKWDLVDAMAKAEMESHGTSICGPQYSVPVSVTYRDANNVWYRSRSVMTYIRSQARVHFGPTEHEKCGSVRPF